MKKLEKIRSLAEIEKDPPAPIDFILPGMVAGTVGVLVGAGGVGKSFLALEMAVQIAGGADLLGLGPLPTGRVAYLAGEDQPLIIEHRLAALLHHLSSAEKAQIDEYLDIYAVRAGQVDLGRDRAGIAKFVADCRLVVIDTLRRFHSEAEGDDAAMTRILAAAEQIAETGCAVLIIHHANKYSAWTGQQDQAGAARGSTVITYNARWQGYVYGMTETEADTYCVPGTDRGRYVQFGVAKINYGTKPDPIWLERYQGGILRPASGLVALSSHKTTKKNRKKRNVIEGNF